MKAGYTKVILQEQEVGEDTSKSLITLPDHLKEKRYKVVDVGSRRTNLELEPWFRKGDLVHLVPNAGYKVKESSTDYVVCGFEDILIIV